MFLFISLIFLLFDFIETNEHKKSKTAISITRYVPVKKRDSGIYTKYEKKLTLDTKYTNEAKNNFPCNVFKWNQKIIEEIMKPNVIKYL